MHNLPDTWFLAEAEENGNPMVLRGRQDLLTIDDIQTKYPNVIRVTWHFGESFPQESTSNRMNEFEERLFHDLESHDQLCIFYCVYMVNGSVEWSAYYNDIQEITPIIEKIFDDYNDIKFEIGIAPDADWTDYKDMLEAVNSQL
ncbi:MAG: DUF695 domain-containing protein [Lentisphaeria bacterium]